MAEPTRPTVAPSEVEVTVRGEVPQLIADMARDKIAKVQRYARGPVLQARVVLQLDPDPARERPAQAEAALDVDGTWVRARVAAPTLHEAVDELHDKLRRRVDQLAERRDTRHRWIGVAAEGQWRHGTLPTQRPAYFPRQREERQVLRRKSFELTPLTPDEAAYEMDLLGHDFYLFHDRLTDRDAVVRRREDGTFGLSEVGHAWVRPEPGMLVIEPSPSRLTETQATERMDAGGEPFVFHVDTETGRGRIVYRRYDGHYGVITAR